jgi:hypothetical protein
MFVEPSGSSLELSWPQTNAALSAKMVDFRSTMAVQRTKKEAAGNADGPPFSRAAEAPPKLLTDNRPGR